MTTPFPKSQSTQIAEKSILDMFGRQTYLGNSFSAIATASLTSSAGLPLIWINNPATSGKGFFFFNRGISTTGAATVSFYYGSTITVDGTPLDPASLRPAYATETVSSVFVSPTVTNNGTRIGWVGTSSPTANTSTMVVIDPGQLLLAVVTAPTASGGSPISVSVELDWYEI